MEKHDTWPFQEALESRSAEDSVHLPARVQRAPSASVFWPGSIHSARAQHRFFLSHNFLASSISLNVNPPRDDVTPRRRRPRAAQAPRRARDALPSPQRALARRCHIAPRSAHLNRCVAAQEGRARCAMLEWCARCARHNGRCGGWWQGSGWPSVLCGAWLTAG